MERVGDIESEPEDPSAPFPRAMVPESGQGIS